MMDVHGWSAALKLSTMWGFQEIRDKAILELDGMLRTLPIQKISKGIKYRVQKWLLDGYGELIRREGRLSEAEARELGFETAWRIGQVREETIVKPESRWDQSHYRNFGNLEAQIRTTFGDQLKDAEYMGNDSIPEIEEWPGSSPLGSPVTTFGWLDLTSRSGIISYSLILVNSPAEHIGKVVSLPESRCLSLSSILTISLKASKKCGVQGIRSGVVE